MDDTQQSRASDAGATRKRRSSILKSQRPPRTPFSELEFNVATPTDTAKSRRVSFSRRTGVAEFVTNEATTTWKNFYEEHNKSLESSGNDSGANATRQPIGHLGKRIFDQQFEEVEAVDFITSLDNLAARNINTTINVNFTEQLASLECSDDKKLTAPQNNFELSAFTDHHSKLFTDDLAIPMIGEMSGRIDVNFSAVQSLDVKDDLDEIQKDLQRRSNVVERAAFRDAKDFSEYIEVELESTQAAHKNEESDMSITETIRSPKVNVSKSFSPPDKKCSLNWVSDKENKYQDDLKAKTKTLFFDDNGDMSITTALETKMEQEKQRTIIFDNTSDISMTKPIPTKLFSDRNEVINKSYSYVVCNVTDLNTDDNAVEKRKTTLFDDCLGDLSMTKPIPTKLLSIHSESKEKTDVNDNSNESSVKTVKNREEKRRTILFEDDLGNLSLTKPIPANFMSIHSELEKTSLTKNSLQLIKCDKEKGKTESDDFQDLSMTKPISSKLLSDHSFSDNIKKFHDQTVCNTEKCKTILFDDGDLSITKPITARLLSMVHSEIINKSKQNDNIDHEHNEHIFETLNNKDENFAAISMSETTKCKENVIEKGNTILFDDCDLSVTKPIPNRLLSIQSEILDKTNMNDDFSDYKNCILEHKHNESKVQTVHGEYEKILDISIPDDQPKRRTIFDEKDLSFTKPIPTELIRSAFIETLVTNDEIGKHNLHYSQNKVDDNKGIIASISDHQPKRRTIFDEKDLSFTKPIPTELIRSAFIETLVTNDEIGKHNLQHSQNKVDDNKGVIADMSFNMEMRSIDNSMGTRKPQLVNEILGNLSMIPDHSEINHKQDNNHSVNVVDERNDVTICKPIPMNKFNVESVEPKIITKANERVSLDFTNFKSPNVVVYQVTTNESSKEQRETDLQDNDSEHGDVMAVQANDNSNNELLQGTINEGRVEEEKRLNEELQKSIKLCEIREEVKDNISKNASIYSEMGDVSMVDTISKKSILCNLLDMSNASISSGLDDKNVTADISSNNPSTQEMTKADTGSATSEMFYITRDTDSETKSNEMKHKDTYPSITFVDKETKENVADELVCSESVPQRDISVHNAFSEVKDSYEEVVNSSNTRDLKNVKDQSSIELTRRPKSFSEVDNTKELLDMLSDLSDDRKSISNVGSPFSISSRCQNATENKIAEPKRVSILPNRQSIVLSREDLLNNISMAQAALQKSIVMEDSDDEETMPVVSVSPPKKSVRVSNEVVKTLHFEDESTSEVDCVKSVLKSPLRKTAFGETSYANEGLKANVIPSYLKDVSDGIKALMTDLVKPVPDEMPFEAVNHGGSLKKSTSTCSTQIQANLYTSSQIDMNSNTNESYSNSDIMFHVEKDKKISSPTLKSVSFIGSDVYAHSDLVTKNLKEASFRPKRHPPNQSIPGKVLVFDHENPLNNVLLTPTEFTEVHKYCPSSGSQETLGGSDKSHTTTSLRDTEYDVANVAVPYNMQYYNNGSQSVVTEPGIISKHQSVTLSVNKPMFIDQAVGVKVTEVKDIEVNTAIVMKKNIELLQASSSLTLVDDALARSTFDVEIDTEAPTESCTNLSDNKAPIRVIYKLKHDVSMEEKIDSDPASNDEADTTKAKKRIYSSGNSLKCKKSSPSKLSPRPTAKVPKLSDTPNTKKSYSLKRISGNKSIMERYFSSAESKMDVSPSKESRKRPPRKKNSGKKEGMSIMVQHLLAEFNVRPEVDQKVLNRQILEALSRTDSSAAPESLSECEKSVELVSSFTSSKNQYKARPNSVTSDVESAAGSRCEVWGAERAPAESRPSVNVVAKIDMLPFMGSHDCEWAPSSTDAWCFQLLHGRLRMSVRLAHRHHNAAGTRVRTDTPVLAVTVHQAHHANDRRNSVAMSCIWFACEAMRAHAASCARAADVPALLARAAGVARSARAWGRAMHDARMHLAYTLTDDQKLVFKVANFPLRCVWEVSMQLALSQSQPPWPHACGVRVAPAPVARALAAPAPRDERLAALLRAVPDGWGHVPTTIWKLFKYLKNKGPDPVLEKS